MVARLVAGDVPDAAVAVARRLVEAAPDSDETAAALAAAVALAARGVPTPEDLEELGGGWVGEEALAIAVACALTADDLPSALSVAVVHSGDSDSTGAICGNLLGAHHGAAAIPAAWLERLEGTAVVDTVARDLHRLAAAASGTHADTTAEWAARYPGS
jgi:ADP-ribosylglycohydrolase